MTHLSLFSGIGGLDLAAHWAGFETIAFVERDEFCQKVLAKHWPGVPIYNDVTTFDGTEFRGRTDVVSAGFPCQPHSLAGERKGSDDERDLWSEVVRILREAAPVWFLGENVTGLFSSECGEYFGRIITDLDSLGYRTGWCCYGACDVDAPHERERVFIAAYAQGKRRAQTSELIVPGRQERPRPPCPDRGDIWAEIKRNRDSENWEAFASFPPRSDDGVPYRVDRLRALGNAVVPAQAYPILQAIADEIRRAA